MPCPAKHFRLLAIVAVLFSIVASVSFGADTVPAKIVGVTDGDTIKVMVDTREMKVRLYGIDAPEKGQPYGQASTTVMKHLTTGRNITVRTMDQDRYGRTVALVYADGICVNEAMVRSGNAWLYQQYCTASFCSEWMQYQIEAKAAHKGLWQDSNPTPPWDWRHGVSAGQNQPTLSTPVPSKQGSQPDVSGSFSGNVKSRKFHTSGCRHSNCSNCTATFTSRNQAIAAGYSPCKICNP